MKWNFLYQITAASRTPDLGATTPRSPFSLSSVLNWICRTPLRTKFLVTPLPWCYVCTYDFAMRYFQKTLRFTEFSERLFLDRDTSIICRIQSPSKYTVLVSLFGHKQTRKSTLNYFSHCWLFADNCKLYLIWPHSLHKERPVAVNYHPEAGK